jgi:hypothetical protein
MCSTERDSDRTGLVKSLDVEERGVLRVCLPVWPRQDGCGRDPRVSASRANTKSNKGVSKKKPLGLTGNKKGGA